MLWDERLVETARLATLRRNCDRTLGSAASNLVAICGLERELALDFGRQGKYSESRTLFMDAIELLEGAEKRRPREPDVEQA